MNLRRDKIVLLALILAMGAFPTDRRFSVLSLLSAEAPSTATDDISQDAANAPPASSGDAFSLPATNDPQLLAEFVIETSQLTPAASDDPAAHAQRQARAMRAACDRICFLATESTSEARQFAEHKLAELDIDELSRAKTRDERETLVAKICAFSDQAPLTNDNLRLIVLFAHTAEQLQMDAAATEVYDRFGPRLLKSTEPSRRELGELMAGASRRLNCVGKPFILGGIGVDGKKFDVAQLKGKIVLVVYWQISHEFFRELMYLRYLYRDFHGQGLELVGVCVDEDHANVNAFLNENVVPWPTLYDQPADADSPSTQFYGVHDFPATFLLDRDGKVLDQGLRGRDLRRRVIQLLGPAALRPIVADAPEATSSIGDMENRILDVGEEWLAAGKGTSVQKLLGTTTRTSSRGNWSLPERQSIDDQELYQRALKSVFVLGTYYRTPESAEWSASTATAFAVSNDGLLCTAAHVVDFTGQEIGALMAFNAAGEVFPVERVAALDVASDICLLQTSARNLVPLPLAERVPVGARVRVVSHPDFSLYYLSAGHVASHETNERGLVSTLISADFGAGSSGAPVFDEYGSVAGLVSSTRTIYATPHGAAENSASGDVGQPQMVFRYCAHATRLRQLFAK